MKLFKSLLLGASLTNFFVSALLCSGPSSEADIAERQDTQLLARTGRDDFAKPELYTKKDAIKFVKDIPLSNLSGLKDSIHTIHSVNGKNKPALRNEKQSTGFRLDHQGKTKDGYHNLQVQINGPTNGKSTIGGILVKGNMNPKAIKERLVHAVMHPDKSRKYSISRKAKRKANRKAKANLKAQVGHSVMHPDKSRKYPKSGKAKHR